MELDETDPYRPNTKTTGMLNPASTNGNPQPPRRGFSCQPSAASSRRLWLADSTEPSSTRPSTATPTTPNLPQVTYIGADCICTTVLISPWFHPPAGTT